MKNTKNKRKARKRQIPETYELSEFEEHRFWLGTFVEDFALVENVFYNYLIARTGMFDAANAILSGTRIKDSISYIKRLNEVLKDPNEWLPGAPYHSATFEEDMKKAFDHVGLLNDFRNMLLHHGTWQSAPDNKITTNSDHTIKARARVLPASTRVLYNASTDLSAIYDFMQDVWSHFYDHEADPNCKIPALKRAFLYKAPPDQKQKDQKQKSAGRKTAQDNVTQPKSSPV